MTRFLLLLLFVPAFIQNLSAQSFDLPENEFTYYSDDLDSVEYVVKSYLINLTNQTVDYVWRKETFNCPDLWEASMCIGELCYLPAINTKQEELPVVRDPKENEYSIHLTKPMGEAGRCDVCVDFWEPNGVDTLTACMFYRLGVTSSNEELSPISMTYYPNPVMDVLNVELSVPMEIVLTNPLGQVEQRSKAQAGKTQMDLSSMRRGIYSLSVIYQGKVQMTRQLIKR